MRVSLVWPVTAVVNACADRVRFPPPYHDASPTTRSDALAAAAVVPEANAVVLSVASACWSIGAAVLHPDTSRTPTAIAPEVQPTTIESEPPVMFWAYQAE
jgi:hypothetical protein